MCGTSVAFCGTDCVANCDRQRHPCSDSRDIQVPYDYPEETAATYGAELECQAGNSPIVVDDCTLGILMPRNNGSCPYCADHVDYLYAAMRAWNLDCPMRAAAFLAQVSWETGALSTFFQPRDNGGGAVHMLPSNMRAACRDMPSLQAAFQNRFACLEVDPCTCGTNAEVGQLVSEPRFAFHTAGWWFVRGAKEAFGGGAICDDLRLQADKGEGSLSGIGQGFTRVSKCIIGFSSGDPSIPRRAAQYRVALSTLRERYDFDLPCHAEHVFGECKESTECGGKTVSSRMGALGCQDEPGSITCCINEWDDGYRVDQSQAEEAGYLGLSTGAFIGVMVGAAACLCCLCAVAVVSAMMVARRRQRSKVRGHALTSSHAHTYAGRSRSASVGTNLHGSRVGAARGAGGRRSSHRASFHARPVVMG